MSFDIQVMSRKVYRNLGRSLLACGLLLLTACAKSSAPTASPTPPSSVGFSSPIALPSAASSPIATPKAESTTITANAIGAAQLGMNYGALKQALGPGVEFKVESPFITDFDAIAVRRDGKVEYYILYLAKQTFRDTDVIQGLLTQNPKFLTAEGIGAGSLLSKAEKAYGKATLSYNTQNESREYVRFERQPSGISFATGNGSKDASGVYSSPSGEYNETQKFKDEAKVKSVLIVCLTEACAPAPSPNTFPAPVPSPNSSPKPSPSP
jgi:hypothetical protein